MKKMIEDLENGNLTDAKQAAKRFSWKRIYEYLRNECDWSVEKAAAAAEYLKGQGTFQAYCDAV